MSKTMSRAEVVALPRDACVDCVGCRSAEERLAMAEKEEAGVDVTGEDRIAEAVSSARRRRA